MAYSTSRHRWDNPQRAELLRSQARVLQLQASELLANADAFDPPKMAPECASESPNEFLNPTPEFELISTLESEKLTFKIRSHFLPLVGSRLILECGLECFVQSISYRVNDKRLTATVRATHEQSWFTAPQSAAPKQSES